MLSSLIISLTFSWMDIEYHEDNKLRALFSSQSLQRDFELASDAFFAGDLETAKERFLLITLKAYDETWSFEQRRFISYSFMRLCQIDRDKCSDYIDSMLDFDRDIIPHLDDSVFEPPLMQEVVLRKNKKDANLYHWQADDRFENLKYVIVNGKIYNHSKGIKIGLPLAKQRLIFVFADDSNQIFVGDTLDFLKWKPAKKALVTKTDVVSTITPQHQEETMSFDDSSSKQWWKKNKKNVILWSIAGAVVTYFIHKNNKSSDDGGSVSAARSKE